MAIMRIAIITENFLPKLDGVTRTLARLLEHLQDEGHQALLLGPECGMQEYAGAEIVGTAGIPLPMYPELKLNFFRPLFIRRLKEFAPDVVHLVDPVMLGAAGLVAARFLQKPLISSYHTNLAAYCHHFGISLLAEPMLQYNRLIHNQCELTFCPSPSTLSALRRQGFQNLRLWPRGVDTTLFQPQRRSAALRASWLQERNDPALSVTDETVIVLYVGRISQEKNLRLLVQAYQSMDRQNCHLVMIGDGPARAEIQQEFAGLPVTFTGYLRGEELATAYASADIFAFPSHTETFGQVVLEAMASGLPVVALHSEGVCDMVVHEHTGLLDEQRTDEEEQLASYKKLLQVMVQQRETRLAMGHAARIEAGRRSWHEAMQYLVEGYYDVVQGTQVRAAA